MVKISFNGCFLEQTRFMKPQLRLTNIVKYIKLIIILENGYFIKVPFNIRNGINLLFLGLNLKLMIDA